MAAVQRAVVVDHSNQVVLLVVLQTVAIFRVDFQEVLHTDFSLELGDGIEVEGEALDEQQQHFRKLHDALPLDDNHVFFAETALETFNLFVFEVVRDQVAKFERLAV